jgi:hypothetical protein
MTNHDSFAKVYFHTWTCYCQLLFDVMYHQKIHQWWKLNHLTIHLNPIRFLKSFQVFPLLIANCNGCWHSPFKIEAFILLCNVAIMIRYWSCVTWVLNVVVTKTFAIGIQLGFKMLET